MQLIEQELEVPKDVQKPRFIRQQREDDQIQFADAENRENRQELKRAKVLEPTTSASWKVFGETRSPWPIHSASCHPLEEPSPLGLSLRKTPSFLELVSLSLNRTCGQSNLVPSSPDAGRQENEKCRAEGFSVASFSPKDKLKAANFPASVLKIGAWERSSRYEGDVVGKCYYAKQKLVWEVLENGLKNKIEVQWSAISAIKASFPENQPGRLQIEVSRPPLFFRETDPQPRKHTLWHATSDFTGGEATICKWHQLWFAEGVLNKHYEKILQCDSRLKALAIVEEGSAVLHSNILKGNIKEEPQVLCFEPDIRMSIPNHLSPLDSIPEHTEGSTPLIDFSHSKLDQDGKALHVSPLIVSSPASVNNTWSTEENYGSDNDGCFFKDDVVALSDIQSEDRASILSGDSVDNVAEYGMPFVSGGVASSEKHIINEITHMLIEEQSASSPEEDMLFSANVCATSAMLDEDEINFPPWLPKSCTLLDGFSVAEVNCNLFETFQGHVCASLNSNTADVTASKRDLTDDGTINNLLSEALDSVKQCFSNDSGEDVLVNLPRIASLPQLFQVSTDMCHSRHESLSSFLETM
ncbi:hypothetical protein O6H91_10G103900 [Diphasiastrum complanatum]|uniref:Uncharacterized protein n=2 Tax=Diphasiastrum complanatum TaxID=34168 RepID=A0ACC2CKA4_DIPCM|nr:hypothetical protein O6H91_10G103900 [Diphasiastrum complanatum]KAJ7542385.1 hypothetical protein O6H91_10G103900 [Diphasiastrum complanatum]